MMDGTDGMTVAVPVGVANDPPKVDTGAGHWLQPKMRGRPCHFYQPGGGFVCAGAKADGRNGWHRGGRVSVHARRCRNCTIAVRVLAEVKATPTANVEDVPATAPNLVDAVTQPLTAELLADAARRLKDYSEATAKMPLIEVVSPEELAVRLRSDGP